ncbi:3'-5' exonuclease [Streptomyces sp. NPDC059708]|uniref:3'-5' exonuclease n=1 Tax=Streptomyces sp. NPDC059708 TaxID=3346916 RepID=UPI00367F251E
MALYEPAAAERMRPLPSAVKRRMAARRTCPACLTVRPDIVRGRRCTACVDRERAAERRRAARTCRGCEAVRERPYPAAHGRCQVCRAAQRAKERERRAAWMERAMVCAGEDCTVRVVTKRTALAWLRTTGAGWYVPSEWPRRCQPCHTAHEEREAARREAWEREAAERAARKREERRREVLRLREWAAATLADPSVVVLDTETCGLDDDSCVVEVAVITAGGEVLLDTLINPGVPVPAEATAVHGITDADVASAGAFSDIVGTLAGILDGRRVLIWKAPYDVGRLRFELVRHYAAVGERDPAGAAEAWMERARFECAMIQYSDWAGEWSTYWGSYRWQALGGGHRALGDARTVLKRLAEMTAPLVEEAGAAAAGTEEVRDGWSSCA